MKDRWGRKVSVEQKGIVDEQLDRSWVLWDLLVLLNVTLGEQAKLGVIETSWRDAVACPDDAVLDNKVHDEGRFSTPPW